MSKGGDKGSIVPVIVIGIALFAAYQSNPEAWRQGKLFTDLMKTSASTVETTDIANIPQQPVEKPYDGNSGKTENKAQPSIRGAKPMPAEMYKDLSSNNPVYNYLVSPTKTLYFAGVKSERNTALRSAIGDGLKASGLDKNFNVIANLYDTNEDFKKLAVNNPNFQQSYLLKNCSRHVCLINVPKREIIPLPMSSSAILARAKELKDW